MALDPQSKDLLAKFTVVAKKIIYSPERMKAVMQMLGTPEGAVTAVQSVISVIQKQRQIPANILPLLGINIYLAMVDVAQAATKHQPDPQIMKAVIQKIMGQVVTSEQQAQKMMQQQTPQQVPQQQPQGIIAGQMGATA